MNNQTLEMLLSWVRKDREYRLIAWGYALGTDKLESWEQMYFLNVHGARCKGISA